MTPNPEPWRNGCTRAAVLVASLLLSSAAVAAPPPSADLAVTGQIQPGACTITAANGGTIDYGILPATQLNQDADTQLPRKYLRDALEIHCPAATRISLTVSDNRQDSAGGNTNVTQSAFGGIYGMPKSGAGLGFDSGDRKIGGYGGTIGDWAADGVSVFGAAEPGGGEYSVGYAALPGSDKVRNGATYVFTQTGGDANTIVSAKDYSLTLAVAVNIAPAKTLTLDRPVKLDGSMSFQLNYL